jgi:hypothetical protein
LISAHNEDVITWLDPVLEKVIDHQHVDLRGIGDAVEHVCGTCGTLPVATKTTSGTSASSIAASTVVPSRTST